MDQHDDEVDLSRRRSFSQLVGNILISVEEAKGHKHCAFGSLEKLANDRFEKLIPGINREFSLYISKNRLMGRNRNTGEKLRLFELNADKTAAFNLINGKSAVGKIVAAFSTRMTWEKEQSFEYVKNLLLDLVKLQICNFSNPVDDEE